MKHKAQRRAPRPKSEFKPLNSKQECFIAEYLIDRNATKAAQRAGYSLKTAYSQGQRLLKHAEIAAAVAAGTERHLDHAEVTAQRVIDEMAALAFSDVRQAFKNRKMLDVEELPDKIAAAVSSTEVIRRNVAGGDGHTDDIHKLRLWDKPKALEMLAKHLGLFEKDNSQPRRIEVGWIK